MVKNIFVFGRFVGPFFLKWLQPLPANNYMLKQLQPLQAKKHVKAVTTATDFSNS